MTEKYSDVLKQIEELKKKAEELRQQELEDVIQQVKKLVVEFKLTPKDCGFYEPAPMPLVEVPKVRKQRAKAAPKYQHPTDPSITWTGQGKQPKWIAESGKTLEELRIKPTESQ